MENNTKPNKELWAKNSRRIPFDEDAHRQIVEKP